MNKYLKTVATMLWLGDNIILARRLKTKTFSGYFESTGGKIEESDHSIVNAAQREIFEETNVFIPTFELQLIDCIIDDPSTFKCFLFTWKGNFNFSFSRFKRTEKKKRSEWGLYTLKEASQLQLMPGLKENLIIPASYY
jgi:8-oxo-dGTP pyrophosphatase MutT (NUDIX family)